MLLGMPLFHIEMLEFESLLYIQIPASCWCAPWEAACDASNASVNMCYPCAEKGRVPDSLPQAWPIHHCCGHLGTATVNEKKKIFLYSPNKKTKINFNF